MRKVLSRSVPPYWQGYLAGLHGEIYDSEAYPGLSDKRLYALGFGDGVDDRETSPAEG